MAGGLLQYSGLVTKTRAMKSRLLKREDFERITEFQTVQETIGFLREQESYGRIYGGHEEIQHRGQVEALIHHSIEEDYQKLYQFGNGKQRKALKLYEEQIQSKEGISKIDASYFVHVWKEIKSFSEKQMQQVLMEVFGTQIDWLPLVRWLSSLTIPQTGISNFNSFSTSKAIFTCPLPPSIISKSGKRVKLPNSSPTPFSCK